MRDALAAAREVPDEHYRAGALAGLAPHLPEALLPDAFAAAREITDEGDRAHALTALELRLPKEPPVADNYQHPLAERILEASGSTFLTFTSRELEVARLIVENLRYDMIADRFGLPLHQVIDISNSIVKKLMSDAYRAPAQSLPRMIETTVMGYNQAGEFHMSFLFAPAKYRQRMDIEYVSHRLHIVPERKFYPAEYHVDSASHLPLGLLAPFGLMPPVEESKNSAGSMLDLLFGRS